MTRTPRPSPRRALRHDRGAAEHVDVGLNILVAAGAIVGRLIIIALIAVSLLTNVFSSSPETQSQGGSPIATAARPPQSRSRQPGSALDRYQTAAQATLNSYGWVDEAAGVAHIPITRAMTLVTEGLLPAVELGLNHKPNA